MRVILPGNRKYLSVAEIIDLIAEPSAAFAFKHRNVPVLSDSEMAEAGWVLGANRTWSRENHDVPCGTREKQLLEVLRERHKAMWTKTVLHAVAVGKLVVRDATGQESEAEDDIPNLFIKTKEFSAWLSDYPHSVVFDKKPVAAEAESPAQRVQKLERVEPDDDSTVAPNSAPQVGRTTTHTLTGKERRVLDAEIGIAKTRALNPDDYHSVWAEIVKMASAKEGCFIEFNRSFNAAKYRSGNGVSTFTKENLKDRMKREVARNARRQGAK